MRTTEPLVGGSEREKPPWSWNTSSFWTFNGSYIAYFSIFGDTKNHRYLQSAWSNIIFPDFSKVIIIFSWPHKFPDLFQFSLTCRNPVQVFFLLGFSHFLSHRRQSGLPTSSCRFRSLVAMSTLAKCSSFKARAEQRNWLNWHGLLFDELTNGQKGNHIGHWSTRTWA